MKTIHIIPKGCPPPEGDYLEIDSDSTVLEQILRLPVDARVVAAPPDNWPDDQKQRFKLMVRECNVSRLLSLSAFGKHGHKWMENALENAETLKQKSYPAEMAPLFYLPSSALLIGKGLSAKSPIDISGYTTLASWNAYPWVARAAQYACHCDPYDHGCEVQDVWGEKRRIGTPTAAPSFYKGAYLKYIYCDPSVPVHSWFASRLDAKYHPPIQSNVALLMAQSALLMGAKEIHLLGIDLCCPTIEEAIYYFGQNLVEVEMVNGETGYTNPDFHLAAQCLADLTEIHPLVKFYQWSQEAIKIKGITYRAREQLKNHAIH